MTTAIVRWFDELSQEGMVRVGDASYYINNDPCHGYLLNGGKFNGLFTNTTKGQPLHLKSGDIIQVEVSEEFKQVTRIK